MTTHTIRFLPPAYPGARIVLACGAVRVGAVFPPSSDVPGKNPWVWRLFSFGEQPARDGRAKDEHNAKGHLMAALALTLEMASLIPIPDHAPDAGKKVGER